MPELPEVITGQAVGLLLRAMREGRLDSTRFVFQEGIIDEQRSLKSIVMVQGTITVINGREGLPIEIYFDGTDSKEGLFHFRWAMKPKKLPRPYLANTFDIVSLVNKDTLRVNNKHT